MPAPDLNPQTPGDQLANTTKPEDTAPVLYIAKHQGAGRWIVVTNDEAADRVGDFVGDKDSIKAEVDRMNAGGAPFVKPEDTVTTSAEATANAAQPTSGIDPTKIKAPVLTAEGWICPEVAPKE
jgi:hypothetical protein